MARGWLGLCFDVAVMTDQDLEDLVQALNSGREAWISGQLGSFGDGSIEQDEDMTLFAPFGGEVIRGLGDLGPRQQRAVSQFQGGTGTSEVVKTIVVGDVVIVVTVDRNEVRFGGRDEPSPWVLRITEVFRYEDSRWIRLHRHADPLIHHRSLDDTLRLLEPR